jgi:UDP-N-acetylglucosamine 2-epimerase (non-hydrolysing)
MIEARGIKFNSLIKTMKPLGFNDYVKLQKHAKAVLSDSGTISEESSILGFKALKSGRRTSVLKLWKKLRS